MPLSSKVFICAARRIAVVWEMTASRKHLKRDFLGALVTSVVLQTRFAAALPLLFFRILEGALPKIKDSSAARIDPKTNPTGRECVPPGGQSLCWRDIGSNAGFIQL
jgi:hypothetical protein